MTKVSRDGISGALRRISAAFVWDRRGFEADQLGVFLLMCRFPIVAGGRSVPGRDDVTEEWRGRVSGSEKIIPVSQKCRGLIVLAPLIRVWLFLTSVCLSCCLYPSSISGCGCWVLWFTVCLFGLRLDSVPPLCILTFGVSIFLPLVLFPGVVTGFSALWSVCTVL